jgi:hypothetical protein
MLPPPVTTPADHIEQPPGFEGARRNAVPPPAFVRARVNPLLLAMWRALPHDAETADDLERCAASGGFVRIRPGLALPHSPFGHVRGCR